jgi:GH15 family glucan-1,4-alpha-glucosidase
MVLFCFVCRNKKFQILKGTYTTVTGEKLVLECIFHKIGKDLYNYKHLHLLVHKTSKEYYATINEG